MNAFTVDLEDWYHGIGLPLREWPKYEKRLSKGFDRLLELLDRSHVRATFYVLGKVIEEHPAIIRQLISGGHEIGCHSYSHTELFKLNRLQFRDELEKCESLIAPFGVRYQGFRAPYFSIDRNSWWAIDELYKFNYTYDSSIYPGDNKRTGITGFRKDIHQLEDSKLWEAPMTTFRFFGFDVATGGAYFRILPYMIFSARLKAINKTGPGIFYIHPWELDDTHPYLSFLETRRRIPHYFNLSKTYAKLERLLGDFQFCPLNELIPTIKSKPDVKYN